MTQFDMAAGFGANGVRRSQSDLRDGLLESTALIAVMPGSVLRQRLQRLRDTVGLGFGPRAIGRKAITGALAMGAMLLSQNVAAHTDALGFIISDDAANPGKYSAEIIYGTYNHGTPSAEGSAQLTLNGVTVGTQAFQLILFNGSATVANGVKPAGLTLGTNYFFVNTSNAPLGTIPFSSGTTQFQQATFTNLAAGTYSFGYVAGTLSSQWTPESPAINAGSFTITSSGALNIAGVTPNIDTAKTAYTTTELAAGGVNPAFTGGTLTVAATGTVANNLTLGNGGGTVDTAGKTLTVTGTIANSGATPGALTVTSAGATGGKLILSGTNTYTGGTYVNGGILQLNSTTAAGTGTIHMVDPTLTFNATGTYANPISLESADTINDPTVLQNISGGTVTLSGAITQAAAGSTNSMGQTVAANQPVQFTGANTFVLTNAGDSWTGATTIGSGVTLALSGAATIANSSSVANSGTFDISASGGDVAVNNLAGTGSIMLGGNRLTDTVTTDSTIGGTITGTGGFTKAGAASLTVNGNITTNAPVVLSAGKLVIGGALTTTGTAIIPTAGTELDVTSTGSITGNSGGGSGVTISNVGGAFTIVNAGTITNSANGNTIQTPSSALTLINSGTVSTPVNVAVLGGAASQITNSGTITGGTSTGFGFAVEVGAGSTVANTGTIQSPGKAGVQLDGAGTINNGAAANSAAQNSASVISGMIGVVGSGALALTNYGRVTGTSAALAGVNATGSTSVITNYGTVEGGAQGVVLNNGGTVYNDGAGSVIRGTGTTNLTDASGIYSAGDLSLTNQGAITTAHSGTVYGVEVLGVGTIANTGTITAANGAAGLYLSGGGTVTNSGTIAGNGDGVLSGGSIAVSNSGTIGTGTVDGSGNFTVGGAGFGVQAVSIALTNTGTINSTGASIYQTDANGTLALLNSGTIGGAGHVVDPDDTVVATGTATIVNTGLITSPNFYGVSMGNGGTLTNAASTSATTGTISAGSVDDDRFAVHSFGSGAVTIDNYGILTSTNSSTQRGILTGDAVATINLYAGSQTGAIQTGQGDDALTLYTGTVTTVADTVADPTNASNPAIVVRVAGSYGAAALTSSVDLGGGTNTLTLAGTGTDPVGTANSANGVVGTLAVDSIAASGGTLNLVKQDAGTWVLTGSANYTGTTTVSGGTLTESNTGSALGNGDVSIASGATLQFDNQTNGQLNVAGTTFTGAGTLKFTGNGTTVIGGNGNTVISLSSGGLIDVESGVVLGSSSGQGFYTDNYAGLTIATGAVFDTVEGTVQVDALNGGGTLQGGFSGTRTITVGDANGSGLFSGVIKDSPDFSDRFLALTKTGTGTQTLTGTNTYTGATTISGGTLALSGSGSIASSASVTMSAGTTLDISGHTGGATVNQLTGSGFVTLGANTLTANNAAVGTYAGNITGTTGGFTKTGAGNLTLSGVNSYTGTTTVTAGTLTGTTSSISGSAIVDNATLAYNQAASGTVAQNISGSGTVTATGLGAGNTLTFSGTDTQTGGFVVTDASMVAFSGSDTGAATEVTANVAGATIGNTGTISGANRGVYLAAGGTVNNTGGTISQTNTANTGGNAAIYSNGNLSLTNSGTISTVSTGASDGATILGVATVTNTGTIRAAVASGLAITANGSTVTNSGTIQGGTSTSFGDGIALVGGTINNNANGIITGSLAGVSNTANALTINNAAGATIGTSGSITSTNGVQISGGSVTINNSGVVRGGTRGVYETAGALALNNAAGGVVVGGTYGVYGSSATDSVVNSGTIASGTYNAGTGAVTLGGTDGVYLGGGGTVTNNAGGLIQGATQGVEFAAAGGRLNNAGTITSTGNGNAVADFSTSSAGVIVANTGTINFVNPSAGAWGVALYGTGSNMIANTGSISAAVGVVLQGTATTMLVNGTTGTITGTTNGIQSTGAGALTLINYGTISGPLSVLATGANTLSLRAGSTTAAITTGAGNDTVSLYTGSVTTAPVVNATTGLTVQTAGTYAAASFGSIALGTGTNAINLRGAGDGAAANGAASTLDLSTVTGLSTLTKRDAGTWTLTGAANTTATGGIAATNAATIYAGTGATLGGEGLVIFAGSGLTGTIYVNGAVAQATGAGTLGTGTIHMVDPTLVFATASATYANNFVLDVARPGQGSPSDTSNDPSTFQANAGVTATLTGSITTGTGNNQNGYAIDANQPVVIAGGGTIVLTNAGNSWTGVTTVNGGATLQGTTASISGGSITDNGVVNFSQAAAGTSARAIAGSGVVQVNGSGDPASTGNVSLTGAITVTGGVQIGAGGVATLSNVSGSNGRAVSLTGAGATLNVAQGGTVTTANGYAVYGNQANATVNNAGTITATNLNYTGVVLTATSGTSVVTNAATGLISGYGGVYSNAPLTLTNAGQITALGTGGNAVTAIGGGTLVNTGTLTATTVGGWGIQMNGAGTVDSQGTINADSGLVVTNGAAASLTNEGAITATTTGVLGYQAAGGTGNAITLTNSGTISGGAYGVQATAAGSSITNSGTIAGSASGAVGVAMVGGTLINQAGGTISAGQTNGVYDTAIQLTGTGNMVRILAGSTVNGAIDASATTDATGIYRIGGTLNGGFIGGSGNDTLTLFAGANVTGTLNGGAGTDTLVLDGTGAGTLGAAQVVSFESGVKQGSGSWTLTGTAIPSSPTSWAVNAGTLTVAGGNAIADTASVTVASGGTFNLAANETIDALAGAGNVTVGANTLSVGAAGGSAMFSGVASGTGGLTKIGTGTETLSGANTYTGATTVSAGTLALGASNVLADASTVGVASGATLDLGANSDTVASLALNGTLAGTGTLTAATYTLNGATVNAKLGAGTLNQAGGTSVLTGTVGTNMVAVMVGTLRLGASDRIADAAMLGVASGATFDLAGFNDTVGTLAGSGTVSLGAGTLTAGGTNADYAFGGNVTGTGDLTKVGTGTFSLIGNETMTGRLNVNAGTVMLAGTTAGSVRVQGGTLTGASTIAGNLSLSSGTLSPGIATQPVAMIQAGSLTVTGGTTVFDFGGLASGFTADLLKITGAASLTGGTVTTRGLDASASYGMVQTYTILTSGALTGTYANGTTFAQVSNNADLYYRLRYDLVANGVVLEIRKPVDFTTTLGAGATGNQLAVARALSGGILTASDSFATTLNAIAALTPDQRRATLDNIGGESIADISTSVALIAERFTGLLREHLAIGGGSSGDASLLAGITGGKRGLDQVRASGQIGAEGSSFADGSADNHAGAWVQTFGGAGRLDGLNGTASIRDQSYGVAAGIDAKVAGLTIGGAFATTALDTRVQGRNATNTGTLYQGGGYVAYDDGQAYASAVGSYFSGDVDSSRQVYVGAAFQGSAKGTARVTGYTAGGAAGYRVPVGGGVRFTPQISIQATHVDRDAFTETGAGGLSLAAGKDVRNLYTATVEGRLSHLSAAPGGVIEPYAGAGVAFNFGDLNTLSANQFIGAPTGTGAFSITGARLAPKTALFSGGIEAHPNDRVTLGMGVETRLSNRERDGRVELHVRLGF